MGNRQISYEAIDFWLEQIHTMLNKQTHQLTTKSVDYESVMFYSTGPWWQCLKNFVCNM
jgi:hypothetical protein